MQRLLKRNRGFRRCEVIFVESRSYPSTKAVVSVKSRSKRWLPTKPPQPSTRNNLRANISAPRNSEAAALAEERNVSYELNASRPPLLNITYYYSARGLLSVRLDFGARCGRIATLVVASVFLANQGFVGAHKVSN